MKLKRLIKKGDTLVEVMFAVGIFGLVAISAIALMNHGLAMSQNTLEVTMARQEIDAQISSLRFVHDAYISEGKQEDSVYHGLWGAITESAYKTKDILAEDSEFYARTVENSKTCDEIYGDNIPSKSFIINPRKLDAGNISVDTVVHYDEKYCNNEYCIVPASVYPRLLYGSIDTTLSDATVEEGFGVVYHNDDTLTSAEGIWVVAVASESEVNNEPDFYDFYVHTCWNRTGSNGSTTINSVIRLYNPDQIVFGERAKVDKFTLIYDVNGGDKNTEPPVQEGGDAITNTWWETDISDQIPTWGEHRFLGWAAKAKESDSCPTWKQSPEQPGTKYILYRPKVTLCAIWSRPWKLILEYNSNTPGSNVSAMGGPSNNVPFETYTDSSHVFVISDKIPVRSGYKFLGWSDTPNGKVKYHPGDEVVVERDGDSQITTKPIYAVWEEDTLKCTKRYHKENADGTWGGWVVESEKTVKVGDTCSYSKHIDDYIDPEPLSVKMTREQGSVILELEFHRIRYRLTVNRNTNYIASATPSGPNYYVRWGASVPIKATPGANAAFTSWTLKSGTGTFGNAKSASTTFTMGKGDASIYANGKSTNTLQNWEGCAALGVGKKVTLIDERDGQEYTVMKLKMSADGTKTACWMSNLNLGAVPLKVSQLDDTNTHLPHDNTKYISAADFASWDHAPYISRNGNSSGGATETYHGHENPSFQANWEGERSSKTDSYGNTYGLLYDYAAAEGGTGRNDAKYDLCPAGWRLPTGGTTSGDFYDLVTAYSVGDNYKGAVYMEKNLGFSVAQEGVYITIYDNNNNISVGSSYYHKVPYFPWVGYYWTSSIKNDTGSSWDRASLRITNMDYCNKQYTQEHNMNNFSCGNGSGGVSTSYTAHKATKVYSIRCIKDDTPAVTYLQDWTYNDCKDLGVGKTNAITLYDKRDGQAYTVTKYYRDNEKKNGLESCWMSNLNLGAEPLKVTELNKKNTNMPTATAVSASDFKKWERKSGTDRSYTDPQFVVITASNSKNKLTEDSYGNKYGTLYNFAAASAKTITALNSGGLSSYRGARDSLCPKGWRLPSNDNTVTNRNDEFRDLFIGYGAIDSEMNSSTKPTGASIATKAQNKLGFSLAGRFTTSATPSGQGTLGEYWSGQWWNDTKMKVLYMSVTSSDTVVDVYSHTERRDNGLPIRCMMHN